MYIESLKLKRFRNYSNQMFELKNGMKIAFMHGHEEQIYWNQFICFQLLEVIEMMMKKT